MQYLPFVRDWHNGAEVPTHVTWDCWWAEFGPYAMTGLGAVAMLGLLACAIAYIVVPRRA